MLRQRATAPAHWSKDFVEHLRTVHFALIAISVGLILIVSKVNTPALSQIRQIVLLKKDWPPSWLYFAGTDRHDRKNVLLRDASGGVAREYGPSLQLKGMKEIVGYVQGVKGHETLRFTLPEENWYQYDNSRWSLSRFPATLSSFRAWWNELQTSHRIYFPYHLCKTGEVYQTDRAHGDFSWHRVGQVILVPGSTTQTPAANPLPTAKTFQLDLEKDDTPLTYEGYKKEKVVDITWKYFANDNVGQRQFRLPVCMVNRVDLDQEVLISGLHFEALHADDDPNLVPLSPGLFEKSFRALSEEVSGLEVEPLEDIEKNVAERLSKRSEEFEAFGMKFPTAQITTWGTVTLLGVQLYFFLYLRRLSGKLDQDDPGWDVPWICLDQSFLAQAILLATVVVLPFATVLVLGIRASLRITAAYWVPDSWHLIDGVRWEGIVLLQIAVFLLASLASLALGILSWRFRPRVTESENGIQLNLFE